MIEEAAKGLDDVAAGRVGDARKTLDSISQTTAVCGVSTLDTLMAQRVTIKLTANFERNLEDIERFLVEADTTRLRWLA